MTTLKQRIAADHMAAFKNKETVRKSILSTVKGEIQTVEKNTGQAELSDEEVTRIMTKTIKSLNETISLTGDEESKEQLAILSAYMPKQMSREEIKQRVQELIASGAGNIGQVMKEFSSASADKKMVAEVFGELKGS